MFKMVYGANIISYLIFSGVDAVFRVHFYILQILILMLKQLVAALDNIADSNDLKTGNYEMLCNASQVDFIRNFKN